MARVKLSSLLTDISGSIGGLTIQRNKYGITARQKPLPPSSFSPAQYIVRRNMAIIQHAWQDLTDAQRLQWKRFLDFSGQTINNDKSVKLNGHALYLKYQMFRLLAGYPLLTTLTYIPMPAVSQAVSVTVGVDLLRLSVGYIIDHTSQFFLFFMSAPRQYNQAPSRQGLRYMFVVATTGLGFEITDSYKAAFGILPGIGTCFHYSIQSFSVVAPVYSGITFGKTLTT